MLTLTENACTIVNTITSQPGAEEINALRISTESGPEASFAVSPADGPESDDQVVEQDGATVYLDPAAADALGDKVLDAAVDDGGNLQFALGAQG